MEKFSNTACFIVSGNKNKCWNGLVKFSISLRKQDLRLLTDTGHVSLNRHLTIMKLRSDPLCPLCKEDSETSLHFLGSCVARMAIRRNIMGAPIMSSEALIPLLFSTLKVCESLRDSHNHTG